MKQYKIDTPTVDKTKMLNEALFDMQLAYSGYLPLWDEWTQHFKCSLNEYDIYLINSHAANNFTLAIDECLMFYNRVSVIKQLTKKLALYYEDFKSWAINRIISALIYMGQRRGWMLFFETPIKELSISEELAISLKTLKIRSIAEIFLMHTNNNLFQPQTFNQLIRFGAILLKEEKKLNNDKTEVIKDDS